MALRAKVLQWVGVLAIVAFGLAGLVSLALVKDRVNVTISEEGAQDQVDPIALLRDEVAVLRGDIGSLANTLAQNLQILAESLDEADQLAQEARNAKFAQLERALAGLEQRLAASPSSAQLSEVLAEVRSLRRQAGLGNALSQAQEATGGETSSLMTPTTMTPTATTPVDPAQPSSTGNSREDSRGASASEAEEATAAVTPSPAPQKKKRGFLAFRLPSQGFDFNRRQRFEIITSLSRVGFDAKSTLHDFTGVTSDVGGQLILNLGDAGNDCGGKVTAKATALKTGVEGRDKEMYEHLETGRHPELAFEVEGFETTKADEKAMTLSGVIKGTMSIRGVSQQISMPVEISVDESRRLVLEGQMPLDITDYKVPVPSQLGMIGMEEEVQVWVSLRARSLGVAVEN